MKAFLLQYKAFHNHYEILDNASLNSLILLLINQQIRYAFFLAQKELKNRNNHKLYCRKECVYINRSPEIPKIVFSKLEIYSTTFFSQSVVWSS